MRNRQNYEHKRYLKNYLLEPSVQLKLAGVVVLTLVLQILLVYGFYNYSLKNLFGVLAVVSGASGVALELVNDELRRFAWWISAGLVTLSFVSSAWMIVYTHRLIGSAYAVTRYVKTNLLNLDFKGKLVMRSQDVFIELRDAVNDLSVKLDETYSESGKPAHKSRSKV